MTDSLSPLQPEKTLSRYAFIKQNNQLDTTMQSVTKAKPIPAGYHSLNHILTSDNASGLIDFLVRGLNGEVKEIYNTPEGKVQHAVVRIGDSVILLSDSTTEFPAFPGIISL